MCLLLFAGWCWGAARKSVQIPRSGAVFPPETRLLSKPGFRPDGFVCGIEVLNDQTTPMEFVVSVLSRHLEISRGEAIVKMLEIHNTGGLLIPFPSPQKARSAADAMAAEARAAGHSFVCRYADTQPALEGDTPA